MSLFHSIAGSYCQLYKYVHIVETFLHITSQLEIENTLKYLQKRLTHLSSDKIVQKS